MSLLVRLTSQPASRSSSAPVRPGYLRRLGLFHPDTGRFVRLLGRPFEATPFDRILLAKTAMEWIDQDFGGLKLRVFADDFAVV